MIVKLSSKSRKTVLCGLLILLLFAVIILFYSTSLDPALSIDTVQYWASANLVLKGYNPYNQQFLREIEHGVSHLQLSGSTVITMWNPPIIIPFILPLGFLPFVNASLLWLTLMTAAIAVSIFYLVRLINFNVESTINLVALFTFYPIVSTLSFGQISPILLLGLTGFLVLEDKHPFKAGLFLSFTLLKPHLLLLVYLGILFTPARIKIVLGIGSGLLLLGTYAELLSPNVFSHYLTLTSSPPIHWHTPTIGSWLQAYAPQYSEWARIGPSLVTMIILLPFFIRYARGQLDKESVYFLIPLSLVTSPYGWTYDQILMLPTILWLLTEKRINGSDQRATAGAFGPLVIATNVLAWIPFWTSQYQYVWYPMAFCILAFFKIKKW